MNFKHFELNKITIDQFSRPNGILALNKPAGITSHDLVDQVRKRFNTRKVGHTGTLDPFATGLMIILVGKATKLSNELLAEEKAYEFDVLFGVSTDTHDPEGEVTGIADLNGVAGSDRGPMGNSDSQLNQINQVNQQVGKIIDEDHLKTVLKRFQGKQQQTTPIFSSVKVDGIKLREYARGSERFRLEKSDGKTIAVCTLSEGSKLFKKFKTTELSIELPKRTIEIQQIKLNHLQPAKPSEIPIQDARITNESKFMIANITAKVSKGTYIRQLAFDIGEELEYPAMLISLKRTAIGDVTLDDTIDLDSL